MPFQSGYGGGLFSDPFFNTELEAPFALINEMMPDFNNLLENDLLRGNLKQNQNVNNSEPLLPFDVIETTDAYKIHVDLPGIKKEDLSVEITPRRLLIKGERKVDAKDDEVLLRRQRNFGKLHRNIRTPANADHAKVIFFF